MHSDQHADTRKKADRNMVRKSDQA
ncbi:uncharacterized protein METZ01_LOCUS46136 [marine metagenome]|uniref:Uncharacterized protein n=1 Tax=marine metagenome TaxID=408172 RepID=A0A381RN44_9ZZZZ